MSNATRVFGLGDVHWGVRDEAAVEVALAAQRTFKPDVTVIGGDLIDCGPFSRHPRLTVQEVDRAATWFEDEIVPANEFLDTLQKYTKQKTVFIEGNHEFWVSRYLANAGTAGRALAPFMKVSKLFGDSRNNFSIVPYCDDSRAAAYKLATNLHVVHGWTACRNAARKHLDLSRSSSVVFHHTHRMEQVKARDPWTGNLIEAFSAGCLCKLQPIYAVGGSPTEWTHGFWVAYVGTKSYTAYPIPIVNGSAILPDGKEIRT